MNGFGVSSEGGIRLHSAKPTVLFLIFITVENFHNNFLFQLNIHWSYEIKWKNPLIVDNKLAKFRPFTLLPMDIKLLPIT